MGDRHTALELFGVDGAVASRAAVDSQPAPSGAHFVPAPTRLRHHSSRMPFRDPLVQPLPGVTVPATFPNPFDEGAPCEAARAAAARVMADFGAGFIAPGLPSDVVQTP